MSDSGTESDGTASRPESEAAVSARDVGLCASCRHMRVIVSGKGSRFVLCERSRTDREYRRYPPLPVLECGGWER